jgi:uncharacterized protein (DUF1810 family)
MENKLNLERFVKAQDPVYSNVLAELRRGRKERHWIWFIFPQLKGLGRSAMAELYGIANREEAEAYLRHPILGVRLLECTEIVNKLEGLSAEQILGTIDSIKFRSSMTLFTLVAEDQRIFREALDKYFNGQPDPLTINRLTT